MEQLLSRTWWVLALRGAVAMLFGILALVWPGITLLVLVSLFAAFALLVGAVIVVGALRNRTMDRGWWLMMILGVVSLAVGTIAVVRPEATLFALILLMAANALVTGALDIAVAIRLRKEIEHEWLLILTGALAVVFGVLVLMFPPAGALALTFFVSFYAMATGILLLVLAFRARRWQKHSGRPGAYRDTTAHHPSGS
jgi:uncharacterized membrane protein HdeD (DUF308 family)